MPPSLAYLRLIVLPGQEPFMSSPTHMRGPLTGIRCARRLAGCCCFG